MSDTFVSDIFANDLCFNIFKIFYAVLAEIIILKPYCFKRLCQLIGAGGVFKTAFYSFKE